MVKILVFGDSIVWGAFDSEGGWADRLKRDFIKKKISSKENKIFNEDLFDVYNFGLTTIDSKGVLIMLKNQMNLIKEFCSSEYFFIFSIGKNDARGINEESNTKISLEDYGNNIQEIISFAREYSKDILFVGLPKIDEEKTTPWNEKNQEYYTNKNLENYDSLLRKVCEENDVNYVPTKDLISKEDLFDGLHPNSKGHEKIFKRVKTELNRILNIN